MAAHARHPVLALALLVALCVPVGANPAGCFGVRSRSDAQRCRSALCFARVSPSRAPRALCRTAPPSACAPTAPAPARSAAAASTARWAWRARGKRAARRCGCVARRSQTSKALSCMCLTHLRCSRPGRVSHRVAAAHLRAPPARQPDVVRVAHAQTSTRVVVRETHSRDRATPRGAALRRCAAALRRTGRLDFGRETTVMWTDRLLHSEYRTAGTYARRHQACGWLTSPPTPPPAHFPACVLCLSSACAAKRRAF